VEVRQAELERLFEEISLRYTAKHGFRTYDILHVASALLLKSRSFWSFDKRACKLAKLEGLKLI
jgi:predicted nucleic acid-binding protein